jgi:hypothetical protein
MKETDILKEKLISTITEKVLIYFNESLENINKLNNKTRRLSVIYSRQVLEYCLLIIAKVSDSEIADITGADRSTVIHSSKVIARDLTNKSPRSKDTTVLMDIKPLIEEIEAIAEYLRKIYKVDPKKKITIIEHERRIKELLSILDHEVSNYVKDMEEMKRIEEMQTM